MAVPGNMFDCGCKSGETVVYMLQSQPHPLGHAAAEIKFTENFIL